MADLEDYLKSKKILVVDDEAFMRTVLGGTIKHIGFTDVSEVRDAKSALAILNAKPFDVCFCDWEMPGMSGLELFKQIKEDQELKNLKFIMVTGTIDSSKVKEAIESGVNEYIAKPFNEDIIRQKLVKVLSQSD
ncbi:MAG: response regulator [Gammaproteobacteria bacterium]|nr:response regulator [Gammaproteobacteria bacterium]